MSNEILPVTWGRRKNGSAWISIGSIEQGPHAACDVELPDWALAALSAQAAEIGSLRLEVEGLRNQRDSAQRSSMEAKDQLAAQAAELARLRDISEGRRIALLEKADEITKEWRRAENAEALLKVAEDALVDAEDRSRGFYAECGADTETTPLIESALAQIREARKP